MKALGNLIITISLIVGVLAAATSYFVPVREVDPEAELELGAVAGRYDPEDAELHANVQAMHEAIDNAREAEKPEPLLPPEPEVVLSEEERFVRELATEPTGEAILGALERRDALGREEDPVSADLKSLLGEDSSTKIKVKSFDFMRWQHWWVYVLACVGLAGGAALVRIANKSAIEKARAGMQNAGDGAESDVKDPAGMLDAARITITDLREALKLIPSVDGRMTEIRHRLGAIQRGELMDFVGSRELLIAQYGLGGFAGLMDQFSAAERQINRAWSAAADGVQVEAISCLALAEELMKATEEKLASLKT